MTNPGLQFFELLFQLGIPLLLLLIGWSVGRVVESRHLRRLDARHAPLAGMLITEIRSFPGALDAASGATLVTAETVISADYFKSLLGKLRGIFGGEVRSYRSMMERARREALIRLMEQSNQLGFNALCNVRLDSADLGGERRRRAGAVMVCIMASGTAYRTLERPRPSTPAATTARAGELAAGAA